MWCSGHTMGESSSALNHLNDTVLMRAAGFGQERRSSCVFWRTSSLFIWFLSFSPIMFLFFATLSNRPPFVARYHAIVLISFLFACEESLALACDSRCWIHHLSRLHPCGPARCGLLPDKHLHQIRSRLSQHPTVATYRYRIHNSDHFRILYTFIRRRVWFPWRLCGALFISELWTTWQSDLERGGAREEQRRAIEV